MGKIYQGRYKSFLAEDDQYLTTVIKYIERNPVRAKIAKRVEKWRWGSGYRRLDGNEKERTFITKPPIDLPRNYRTWVNTPDKEDDLTDIRASVQKGKPFGPAGWIEQMVEKFGLHSTMRSGGRPKNGT